VRARWWLLSSPTMQHARSQLKGIEYRVASPQPTQADGLIVLEAWNRTSASDDGVELLALYYCLWGTIYQAPDLYSVLSTRAVSSRVC
jgi:hypothetical protein